MRGLEGGWRVTMGNVSRRIRTLCSAVMTALTLAAFAPPVGAAPVAATADLQSVAMACPLVNPADVAAIGDDAIVVGPAIDATDPFDDLAICRIRADGTAAWSHTIAGVLRTSPISVAVGSGGIYVAANSIGTGGNTDGVIRRFAQGGTPLETASISSTYHDTVADVAVAPDGSVYVVGSTEEPLAGEPVVSNHPDAVVQAFTSSLSMVWSRQFHGTKTDPGPVTSDGAAWAVSVAADGTGVYVAGTVAGALDDWPAARGLEDTFVRRYSSLGAVAWTRQVAARWPDPSDGHLVELQTHPADLALSSQGVHVVGTSQWLGDRDIDRREDAFQRVYGRDGSIIWTRELGGYNDDGAIKVLPDATGSVMFGFAPEGLGDPGGAASMFLARFNTAGSVVSTIDFWPDGWWLNQAKVVGDGNVVRIASVITTTPPTDPPDGFVVPPEGTNLLTIDLVPPAAAMPTLRPVRLTTLGATTIPLDASWSITDGASGVDTVELQVSLDGAAWQGIPVASASGVTRVSARLGGTIRLRVRGTDGAGNLGDWTYGPLLAVLPRQENDANIHQSSSWTRVDQGSALGGHVDRTKTSGAWARYTFNGRSIVWVATTAPTRGRADVYIDGVFAARVDLYSAAGSSRRVAFERSWSTAGIHKIEIRNRATLNRPVVDLDAFIVIR
jgi:hypothetical protein